MAQPVGVPFEADDLGVMNQAVDHGADRNRVAEDLRPGAERLVAADDQRGPLIPAGDEGIEQPQVDRDMSSYRGQPVDEVKSALERIMRRHGLQPNPSSSDFQQMVR